MEELTAEIIAEYQKKAEALDNNPCDIGARNDLKRELQNRCGIPEVWALNIINGHHAGDYLAILKKRKEDLKKKGKPQKEKYSDEDDFLEWQAQKETENQINMRIEMELDGKFE